MPEPGALTDGPTLSCGGRVPEAGPWAGGCPVPAPVGATVGDCAGAAVVGVGVDVADDVVVDVAGACFFSPLSHAPSATAVATAAPYATTRMVDLMITAPLHRKSIHSKFPTTARANT
jgi:hypothetical protein